LAYFATRRGRKAKANELTGLERLKKGLNSETRKKYKATRDCLRAIEFHTTISHWCVKYIIR